MGKCPRYFEGHIILSKNCIILQCQIQNPYEICRKCITYIVLMAFSPEWRHSYKQNTIQKIPSTLAQQLKLESDGNHAPLPSTFPFFSQALLPSFYLLYRKETTPSIQQNEAYTPITSSSPPLRIATLLFPILLPHQWSEDFPDYTTDLFLLLRMTGLECLWEKQLKQLEYYPHYEKYAKNGDHVHSPQQFQHPTRILQSTHPPFPALHIHKLVQTMSPMRSCNNLMLGLFFEKSEKVSFLPGGSFLRVSNNLDSQYYVLQRVKGAKKDYIPQEYFDAPHPQLLEYFTAWLEKELVQQEEAPAAKKPKEKKGIGGLLSKKSMTERVPGKSLKETKEELPVMVQEEVVYVQLESFSEVAFPNQQTETRQFMALIYLLAMRVFERFNCWPHMLPVITQSKHYKFVKRGQKAQLELARLFEYAYKQEKMKALGSWAPAVAASIMELDSQEERKELLGAFLKEQLETILQSDFSIKVRKGQECQVVTVAIEDAFTLVLKELNLQLSIQEYEISYYHQGSQTRQIIMEHNTQPALVLEGNRNNLIIKYLKQFVIA